jgi:formylglycine-generating enzyme
MTAPWKFVLGVSLLAGACHDLTSPEEPQPIGQAGGETNVSGNVNDGGSFALPLSGASGAATETQGGHSQGGHSQGPVAPPEGGAGQPMARSCEAGASCDVVDVCWLGTTTCEGEYSICEPQAPAPARTPCGLDGECTGDGACIKRVSSCAAASTSGCGVVTIPGGSFRLGFQRHGTQEYAGDPVTVGTFAIDAYEVTVARFREFWKALPALVRSAEYPDGARLVVKDLPHEPETTAQHPSYNWTAEPGSREDHPINRLSWETAFLFCAWDGGRLPTEAEWEYVATGRSIDGLEPARTFPWGESPPACSFANISECDVGTTVPVNQLGAWGGVHHMGGNITEWTADAWSDIPGECWDGSARENPLCRIDAGGYHVAKGGSFQGTFEQTMGAWRLKSTNGVSARGARCARNLLSGVVPTEELD